MPKLVQTICIDTPEPTCGAHKSIVKDRTGLLPIEHKQDGGGHIYFCPLCAEDKVHNPLRSVVRRHIEVSHFQMRINHEEWMILPCELRCSSGFKTTHFHCPKCGHARAKDWNQLQAHMRSCTSVYAGPSSSQPAVSARQAALSNQDTGQHSVEASVSKTAVQAAVNNTKRSSPRIVVSKSGFQQQEVDSPPVANVRQSTRIRWKVDQGKRHLEDSPSMKQEHESPVLRTEVLSNTAGTPEKRPRGRPRKRTIDETEIGQVKESPPVKGIPQTSTHDISESPSKRPRGRPRSKPRTDEEVKVTKIPDSPTKAVASSCTPGNEMDQLVKRKRGRPRKYTSESQDQQGIQKKLDIEVISRRMSKDSIGVKQSSMSTLNSSRSKITATSLTQKLDTGQKISSGQTEQADNPEGVGSNLNSIGDHLLYASPGRPSSKTRDVYKQRLLELEEEDKKNPDKPRTVHRSVVHSLREIRPMPYKMGPCATSLYYCPLCRHSWFKPCILSKVFKHIEITHFAHQLEHNGKLVLPCHLTCNKTGKGHRHCPICGKITPNKLRFQMHLKHCNRHTHNASVYAKREQEYRAQLKNSMDWKVAWGLPTEVPAETNAVAAESGGAQVLAGANTETCEVVPDVSSGAETYEMVPSAVPVVELSEPGSSSGQITKPSGNDDPSVSRPSESSEMLLSTTQVGQPIETAPSASQADQPSEMIPSADQPEQSSKMAPIASQAEEPCEMVPSASQQTSETAPSVTSGGAGTDTATNAATTDVAVASDTTQLNLKSELQMDTGMASASGADTSILVHRVLTDEELTAASILSMVEKGIVTVSEASPQISQQIALETGKASLIQPVPEDSHQPPEATATEPVDEWVETHIGKHPSFVKDLTSLGLEPCATCCRDQCLYHCPLCTTATFKPGNLSKVQLHLYRSHWKKRVEYGGLKILKCSLPCVSGSTIYLHGHYHCPLCSVAKATRNKLLYHLSKPHDQFSDPSMAQLLDEERLVGYSGEDDDGGEYEGEGGYMDNYEEEEASSPPSPPKPKEVFQLVAALVTKDMLNLIPGSKDVFFHGLQKKTGVSFTMAEDKWCLLQGKWQPMQEAQCTLRKVLDGESPELGMPSSQDTSTQMAASLADTPAEATPKKTGGQVPSPAEVSPSMPQPSAATIPFGTNDDSNLDTSYEGMAAEEAEDDYDGDQGSSFVDDSTKASTSDQGQEKSDKEPNIANHPAINVVCDESGTCVLTISVPKEEESKPAKVEQKHDKKMFLPRRIDKTQKYKLFTDDRERTCYFCGKIFLQRPKLLQHLLSSGCAAERAGKAKYPEAVEELKTLIKEANERVKDRRCPLCKKQFSRSGDAKVHYLGRTCQRSKRGMHNPTGVPKDEKGMYKCRYCSFTAIRPNKIVIHEARLHIEKKFECTTCGKKYGTEYLLNMHVKTTHRPKTDLKMCHVCGKEMWYRYLQRHIKMKHDPNYKPQAYAKRLSQEMLQCGECPYQTRVPILMKRHTIRHHGEKKFICEVCGKSFAMKEDYSKHIAVHDPSAREKLLVKCEVCNKIMMKKNLNNHMRYVHEKRKDCECPVCGMKLQTTNTLRVHMERHKPPEARNMKYQCPHCNKGFYSKTHYTDHVNSHTNTRPYQCEICNKTFTWLSVYNKHKERHESPKEGKDYICACGCIFAKYTSLRNHQASCEMYQKEMYCECGQLFSTNAALRNHRATCEVWQTQHGTQEVTIIVEQDPSQPIEGQTLLQDIAGGQLQAADAPIQMAVDGTQLQLSEHIVEGMGGEVHIQVEQQEAIKEEADTSILDEQNRYLCGYCQQLFHGLTEVHTHMLEAHVQADMENGTQLQITLQSEEMNIE